MQLPIVSFATFWLHYLCQVGYVIVVVCLSVSNFAQKLQNGFA